ncbi:hypothetical protein HYV74_02385 [Candidatus Uhrbacteria bacterium]|nr:hypothetical protein [Candidatus Uhrbacteria bacterium]
MAITANTEAARDRFHKKTAEQIAALVLGDDYARHRDIDQAKRCYAMAGVPVTPEQYLTWAEQAEQLGWEGSAHTLYQMARDAGDTTVAARAQGELRRLCVQGGDLFRLENEFHNPTSEEFRTIAAHHLSKRVAFTDSDERFRILERIATLLRDRKLLWATFRLAMREGHWIAFETMAGRLTRVPTRRERLTLARVMIRQGWSNDNRRRVITYLKTHRLRELYGEALIDSCTFLGWNQIRKWAKWLHYSLTEQDLIRIRDEYRAKHYHTFPILAELARRFPKRWRSEYHTELRDARARALKNGDAHGAEYVARAAHRPLTLEECRQLLSHHLPTHSGSPERESREIAERLVREAAERLAKQLGTTHATQHRLVIAHAG